MTNARFDVIGIGNAIVDVLAQVDEQFLVDHKITKGDMTLINTDRAEYLYSRLTNPHEVSGGAAANSMVGIASLGGKPAFVGTVADDGLGRLFRKDIVAAGVACDTPFSSSGTPTARSMIVVTPDGQRSMSTYLGAAGDLTVRDIKLDEIGAAEITFLEGYLFNAPSTKEAFYKAAEYAHAAGRKVALSLSAVFCIELDRPEFEKLASQVDILFGNEDEMTCLYKVSRFDDAVQAAKHRGGVSVLTCGAAGAVIVGDGEVKKTAALPSKLVDTTGAGDLFAAGFLYGLTHGKSLDECGNLGAIAAAEIISHIGARPLRPLKELMTFEI